MTFKIIQGGKEDKEALEKEKLLSKTKSYLSIYYNALDLLTEEMETGIVTKKTQPQNRDALRKAVFAGMMYYITVNKHITEWNLEQAEGLFEGMFLLEVILGLLTPNEFLQTFPVNKTYDGDRWGTKDYFSTMETFGALCGDVPIGEQQDVFEFLWDAVECNNVREYMMHKLSLASRIRRMQGGKGLMEEFMEQRGLPTYTKTADIQGKECLVNNQTNEIIPLTPAVPKHLKVVK